MPPMEQAYRTRPAVYWERIGADDYGEPLVKAPVEIRLRWDDVSRERLDPQGNTVSISGELLSDRALVLGSVLWKGSLDDIPGTSAVPPGDLHQVIASSTVYDAKGRAASYESTVMRYKDQLPARA